MKNYSDLLDDLKIFYENESSGHDYSHMMRVYNLALEFAKNTDADINIITLASLLHDCDDYKLVGIEEAEELTNTRYFLEKYEDNVEIQARVISIIKCMGYSNRLNNIYCEDLEGQIVSDADMCDSLGSHGILRTYQYNYSKNREFFNPNILPTANITKEEYQKKNDGTAVNHFFEKLLLIKKYMQTPMGKNEAEKRFKIMVDFLRQYFIEENQEDWLKLLDNYLISNSL